MNIELESLTIYNNNITDVGAIELANTMVGNTTLRILNLQMNFIKDKGGEAFIKGLEEHQYKDIWKIILLDNQCTEAFKRKVKKYESIVL